MFNFALQLIAMGELTLIILAATIVVAILYRFAYLFSGFKNRAQLHPIAQLLCWFIVLYTPVQVLLLLMAGQYMPLANTKDHIGFSAGFTASHAIMAIMGMVVSRYFYKRTKIAMMLLIANAASAIFYTMAAIIFLMSLMK